MALDFEDDPQPFAGFDNLKIEQNESLVSDSFENLFDQEDKKNQLRKKNELEKNPIKIQSDLSMLIEND